MDFCNLDKWSTDEVLGFFYGLNSVFVCVYYVEDKWEMITQLVKTKSYEEVVRFGNWYFFSEVHNFEPWTEVEHACFMQAYDIFGNDFIRINTFLSRRSLMNLHVYATVALSTFKHKQDFPYYEPNQWKRLVSVAKIQPTIVTNSDMGCYESVDWSSSDCFTSESSLKLFNTLNKLDITTHDFEPIQISDVTCNAEIVDDDSLEFLFETLFN